MRRTAVLSREAAACLAGLLACAGVLGGESEPGGKPDVELHVVVIEATGRAAGPEFDPRTPRDIRRQLEGLNLAYAKYTLVSNERKPARFGAEATFGLPEKEALAVRPSADEARPDRVRLGCRVLDEARRPILISPMRVSYDKTFFLQRLKGGTGILMGITARKQGEATPKP